MARQYAYLRVFISRAAQGRPKLLALIPIGRKYRARRAAAHRKPR